MAGEDQNQQQDQTVRYRVVVDGGDVHASIAEIQAAADRAAASVSAMASNMLSTLRSQASDSFGIGQAATRDVASMIYSAAPRPGMTQMGPSLVGPLGNPSINLFRPGAYGGGYQYQFPSYAEQSPYAPPVSPILHPNDPRVRAQARSIFDRGMGGLGNFQQMMYGLAMRSQGAIAGSSNLEVPVYSSVEQQSEAFGRNMGNFLAGDLPGIGMGIAGFALGGPVGLGLGLASFGAGLPLMAINKAARPYAAGADALREYTAPYIRGSRLGPGMSMRDTVESQRSIQRMANNDKFLTAKDYRDIIEMSGEAGVFQFTGTRQQAEKAIEKMAENVKTLHALGVKSRDMLKSIDHMMGSFGINPAMDPQRVANMATFAAITGQSAGLTPTQMMERGQMTAQQFMSQGLGPMFGGKVGMFNEGVAGAMARSGVGAGFISSYFGGTAGLASSLNTAYGAMGRSPFGQMAMLARFGNGMNGPMSVNNIMNNLGGLAGDPAKYGAMQLLMPMLSQNGGPNDMLDLFGSTLHEMKDISGTKDAAALMAIFGGDMGLSQDQQLALLMQLAGAKNTQASMRRDIFDRQRMLGLEARRSPGLGRQIDKFKEGLFAPFARAGADFREFQAGLGEGYQEWATGERFVNLGRAGLVGLDPVEAKRQSDFRVRLGQTGFGIHTTRMNDEDLKELARRGGAAEANHLFDTNELFRREVQYEAMRQYPLAAGPDRGSRATREAAMRDPELRRKVLKDFAQTQERNIGVIQGMNSFNRMSNGDQDAIRANVNAMMQNHDIRGNVLSYLHDDPNRTVEERLTGLRRAFFKKDRLTDEQENLFGQYVAALDVGFHPFGHQGDVLNDVKKGLGKLAGTAGFENARQAKEATDKTIDDILAMRSTDNDAFTQRDLLKKGGAHTAEMLQAATYAGYARTRLMGGTNSVKDLVSMVMKTKNISEAEAYSELGIKKDMDARTAGQTIINRFLPGGDMANLAKEEGVNLDQLVNIGNANADPTKSNSVDKILKGLDDVAKGKGAMATFAAQGGETNFGVELAGALAYMPGFQQKRGALESSLGASIEKYFENTGEGGSRQFDKMQSFARAMLATNAGSTFIDDASLRDFSSLGAKELLTKYMGYKDANFKDASGKERAADDIAQEANDFIRSHIAPSTYNERMSTGSAYGNLPDGQAIASMQGAMGELIKSTETLSRIAGEVDTSSIEKALQMISSTGAGLGGDGSVNSMTVKVSNLTIVDDTEKKKAEGGDGLGTNNSKRATPYGKQDNNAPAPKDK